MNTDDTKIYYIEIDKNTTSADLQEMLLKIIADVKAEHSLEQGGTPTNPLVNPSGFCYKPYPPEVAQSKYVEPIEKVHQDFYHFAREYLYDDYYKLRENLIDTHERTADGSKLPKLPTPPCIDDILNLARKLSKELKF